MSSRPKNNKIPLIAESIEMVATYGPMTNGLSPIPNKDGSIDQFEITESETEVAITMRFAVLHATQIRGDNSFTRSARKSLRNSAPIHGYDHGSALSMMDKNNQSVLAFSLKGMEELIAAAKAKGKVVRLCIPKEGVPIYFGKDWNEQYDALQKKNKKC